MNARIIIIYCAFALLIIGSCCVECAVHWDGIKSAVERVTK